MSEKAPWSDEFALINAIVPEKTGPGIRIGAGDDAALLASLSRPVISTDTQREGVHFLREWMPPKAIGYKAAMAALSDLAASLATPVAVFVNFGLSPRETNRDVIALQEGITAALSETGGSIAGGNISGAEKLSIDLMVVGEGAKTFGNRKDARPGDRLYATGPLGIAGAGCDALLTGTGKRFPELVHRFARPVARFDAAKILIKNQISAVMDISDGLMGDAAHMAKASGITMALSADTIPVDPLLASYCEKTRKDPVPFLLGGGEDYELLFAAPPAKEPALAAALPGLIRVGECRENQGEPITGVPAAIHSFQHRPKG